MCHLLHEHSQTAGEPRPQRQRIPHQHHPWHGRQRKRAVGGRTLLLPGCELASPRTHPEQVRPRHGREAVVGRGGPAWRRRGGGSVWGSSLSSEIPGGSGEKKSSWVKTLYEMTIQDLFRVWECPKLLSAPIQFSSKNKLSFFSRLTLCPHSWTSPFHSASFPTTALPSCSDPTDQGDGK